MCSASISAIRDSAGRVAGYIFVARDVTAQKRAEHAFQKSEERFRRLFESNIIGLMRQDAAGHLLEANDALLKMIGYTREDFAAGHLSTASLTP